MTEFPALRDSLVRAAARRRRRRRIASAGVPVFAAGAAAVVFLALPGTSPEYERVAGPLEQSYAVYRRPQTAADRLPNAVSIAGDRTRTRLIARDREARLFAVPGAHGEMCLIRVPGGTGCGRLDLGAPFTIVFGERYGMLVPDGVQDVHVLFAGAGPGQWPRVHGNGVLASKDDAYGGAAWTDASVTRHVVRGAFGSIAEGPPGPCPAALDPLPGDAIARARRVGLISVEKTYPWAVRATVTRVAPTARTPCSSSITGRSIEVSLRLVLRDPDLRGSRARTRGRLLLGMIGGRMTVYRALH